MLARVTYARKVGLPAYSSVGATCELSWETSDPGTSLCDQIEAAYGQCERAVADQLARALGDGEPWDPKPLEQPEPADVLGPKPLTPHVPPPVRKLPGRDAPDLTTPRTARSLFPWAKKLEDSGYPGAVKLLGRYGREHDLGWKTGEWDDEDAAPAAAFVMKTLSKGGANRA